MISINNEKVDLVLQVEDYTNIQKVFDTLTLDTHSILIVCPVLFLQRFMQLVFDELDSSLIDYVDRHLEASKGFLSFGVEHKHKNFSFHFIILSEELRTINHPFRGEEQLGVGFKEIKIG